MKAARIVKQSSITIVNPKLEFSSCRDGNVTPVANREKMISDAANEFEVGGYHFTAFIVTDYQSFVLTSFQNLIGFVFRCKIAHMTDFFAADFQGPPFELFGNTHLAALGALILLNLILISLRNISDEAKATVRWLLALILVGNEIAWHYWNYVYGKWMIQTMLPLHLCSLLVWTGAFMLITKNYRVYEFMYFMGIAGTIQALATPGIAPYGFPHFVFLQYFLSHGLIATSAIYMTVVEGFRPRLKSIPRVVIWMNIYVVIIYFVNIAIGSNYLMINYKPETPSLLDLLPEWPIYILYMELIGIISVLLLYFPFAVKDLWDRYFLNRDNASRLESISK